MIRVLTVACSVFLVSVAALGQEAPVSTIETEGWAVVDTAPIHVEFWLHREAAADTLAQAMDQALLFEPTLRKELESRELTPSDLTFSGVTIPDVQGKIVTISARLRFSATAFNAPDEGPRQFAALCDKIAALSAALACRAEGPVLGIDDTQSVEDAAVARATEKAYPAAKATAQVMNGQIVAVERVVVESVVWNDAPGVKSAQPDLRRLTCTATVRVIYTFIPS